MTTPDERVCSLADFVDRDMYHEEIASYLTQKVLDDAIKAVREYVVKAEADRKAKVGDSEHWVPSYVYGNRCYAENGFILMMLII